MILKSKITTLLLAGTLAFTSASAVAQRNSSETNPTPEVTRNDRSGSSTRQDRLRGDDEWVFVNEDDMEFLGAFRMDMESDSLAELMVDMVSDPEMFESELDFYYEGSLRVDREYGYCEGVEAYDPDSDLTMFMVVCADDTYVNMVMGTNEDDALEAMGHMQDGYVPHVRGYEEDESE